MKYKSEEHKHAALAIMYGVSGKFKDIGKLKGLSVPVGIGDEWVDIEKTMEKIQEDKRLVDDTIRELCRDEA